MQNYPQKDEILDLVIELKRMAKFPNQEKFIEIVLNNLYVKYMVPQADLLEWKTEVKLHNRTKNKI